MTKAKDSTIGRIMVKGPISPDATFIMMMSAMIEKMSGVCSGRGGGGEYH